MRTDLPQAVREAPVVEQAAQAHAEQVGRDVRVGGRRELDDAPLLDGPAQDGGDDDQSHGVDKLGPGQIDPANAVRALAYGVPRHTRVGAAPRASHLDVHVRSLPGGACPQAFRAAHARVPVHAKTSPLTTPPHQSDFGTVLILQVATTGEIAVGLWRTRVRRGQGRPVAHGQRSLTDDPRRRVGPSGPTGQATTP